MKKSIKDNKGIILISVGLLLLLSGWFYYSQSFEKDISTENPFQNINTNMDLEKGKEVQENKIDAYKDEIRDSIALSNNKDVNLDFDMDTDVGFKKEDKIQRKVDSILKLNQVQYNYNTVPQKRVSSSNSPSKIIKKEVIKIDNESMSNFFANQPVEILIEKSKGSTDDFIYVSINGDQTVLKSGRVNLILNKDALIEGRLYRKNTFLYAIAKFGINRVLLEITNINHIPVSLMAYDAQDGNVGIYTDAESLSSETFSEVSTDVVRDVNVSGIPVGETVKKIFQRKAKVQKVILLNNYKLILKAK